MRAKIKLMIALLLIVALATACNLTVPATIAPTTAPEPTTVPATDEPQPEPTTVPVEPEPTAAPTEAPAVTLPEGQHLLTILYTNDEHGWMEGVGEGLGAAELVGVWRKDFGYTPDGPFLVLSGGDMWTGPAISTWFNGASMVQVMNLMGYRAAAVGNHEFDFGFEQLSWRTMEMDFPLLSANIRYRDGGGVPVDLGISPFVLLDVDGLTVGVIGLSLLDTPKVTKPEVVAPLEFIDYEDALREIVPQVWAAGADLIVVPAHICRSDISALARAVADLGISIFGSGHCNDFFSQTAGDSVVLGGGSHLQSFAYAQLLVDTNTGTVSIEDYGEQSNRPGNADPAITEMVAEWRAEAEVFLSEVVAYSDQDITRHSNMMHQMIVESWLVAFPNADVALTNTGGIRADIKAGEITIENVITVLPFENTIIEMNLTGEDLRSVMIGHRDHTAMAGLDFTDGDWVLTATGEVLDLSAIYVVLVNDFMYTGGDGYTFANYAPDGYDTSTHYRQPLIDWFRSQSSDLTTPIISAIEVLIGK